jgi:predicted ATPase
MISTLELNGFKSFVADDVDFSGLTLLTGINSSGKSSVVQAILLLEKCAHRVPISLKGHGNLDEMRNPFSKSGINLAATLDHGNKVGFTYDKGKYEYLNSFIYEDFPKVIYIGADRYGPETSMPIFHDSFDLGSRGENLFKCIEHNENELLHPILWHENSQGETFLFNLEAWLGVISPNVKFHFEIQQQSDSSYGLFNDYRAKNVGFGLSYSLPVITALLLGTVTRNSLVIVENPEAHLHPRGQTEMARLICKCVEAGAQVIIETHSDHLLNGVRIYTKISNIDFYKQVLIHWFQLDENKNTELESTTIAPDGRLYNWPIGLSDQFEINASQLL